MGSKAKHRHVLRLLPAVLLESTACTEDTATSYGTHAFRRLYPTLAAQLELTAEQAECVGHWTKGSKMPKHYNSVQGAKEILVKNKLASAVASGWTPAPSGAVPRPVPVATAHTGTTSSSGHGQTPPSAPPTAPAVLVTPTAPAVVLSTPSQGEQERPGTVWVSNVRRMVTVTVHQWRTASGVKALCGRFECGTPERPTVNARFWSNQPPWTDSTVPCTACSAVTGQQATTVVARRKPSAKASSSSATSSSSEDEVASSSD